LLELTVTGFETFILLFYLLAKGCFLSVESNDRVQVFDFIAVDFLIIEEGDLFFENKVCFTADDLEAGLKVVELDGKFLVLVGHTRNLSVHNFVFLLQLVNLVREPIQLNFGVLQLPKACITFSISMETYFY
jgi:hypothetical protein